MMSCGREGGNGEEVLTTDTENAVEMSCAINYCEGRYDNLPRGVPL